MEQYIPITVFIIFIAIFLIAFIIIQVKSKDEEPDNSVNTPDDQSEYTSQNNENENS